MIWRWLRRTLCRLGVDAACDNNAAEVDERARRMRVLTAHLDLLAGEFVGRADGGRGD